MRRLPAILLVSLVAACVPTTKYRYVAVSQANFEAAQKGERIPLVADETALCLADGQTVLVRHAEWTESGICGQLHTPVGGDDGHGCHGWEALAGIGIPYESRSASFVPMAAVQIGQCDPESLSQ